MGTDLITKVEFFNTNTNSWEDASLPNVFVSISEAIIQECLNDGMSYDSIYQNVPFSFRNYRMFGWLANVRNLSDTPYLSEPKGIPNLATFTTRRKFQYQEIVTHFTLNELIDFPYFSKVVDHRTSVSLGTNFIAGGGYDEKGITTTYYEFLPKAYFTHMNLLKDWADQNQIEYKNIRIIFGFSD
jgi:hypothetical protein